MFDGETVVTAAVIDVLINSVDRSRAPVAPALRPLRPRCARCARPRYARCARPRYARCACVARALRSVVPVRRDAPNAHVRPVRAPRLRVPRPLADVPALPPRSPWQSRTFSRGAAARLPSSTPKRAASRTTGLQIARCCRARPSSTRRDDLTSAARGGSAASTTAATCRAASSAESSLRACARACTVWRHGRPLARITSATTTPRRSTSTAAGGPRASPTSCLDL